MSIFLAVTIGLILSILFLPNLYATPKNTIQVYGIFELKFESEINYENFIADQRLQVLFKSPDGSIITQDAYWDLQSEICASNKEGIHI